MHKRPYAQQQTLKMELADLPIPPTKSKLLLRGKTGCMHFERETIPQEWTKFRDKVSDNFRVITHEKVRVLK